MKTSVTSIVAIVAVLGSASLAFGQNNAEPGRRGPHGRGPFGRGPHGPDPVVLALDANHDRVISADEIANAPAVLSSLDRNADGQLTADETCPPRPADAPPPPPDAPRLHRRSPVFRALDTNGDGVLSAAEISVAASSLLALDRNHDGQLTVDEFRPQPPAGAPQGAPPPAE